MSTSDSPNTMKPPRPAITGPKIIRFTTPTSTRRFAVHSDLICLTSTLFASKLSTNRKPLSPDSSCSICHDALDPVVKDVDFCQKCGQNVHVGCIEGWKRRVTRKGIASNGNGDGGEDGGALPTCPMCRADWRDEPLLRSIHGQEKLDSRSVQRYIEWLYTRQFTIPEEIERTKDEFNVAVLKCWAVAAAMGDETFRDEVVKMWFEEAEARFWSESVKWAFVDDCGVKEIKDFVIEIFLAFVEPGWFREESARWPEVFVIEMGEKLLEGGKRRKFEEMKKRWFEKLKLKRDGDSHEKAVDDEGYDLEEGASRSLTRGTKRSANSDEEDDVQMRKRQHNCSQATRQCGETP